MRLLIIEHDGGLVAALLRHLRNDQFAVDHTACGDEAIDLLAREAYSAAILDMALPKMAGPATLKRIRQAHIDVPILALTAQDTSIDRVNCFDLGADDCLSKPFAMEELKARIRSLIRRAMGTPEPVVILGSVRLDQVTGATYVGDEILKLTRRERCVLETLATRMGNVVTKARLTSSVFGYDDVVAPNALEVYIGRLRRKLERSGMEIQTVRGLGYCLRQVA